jgi:phenylacetic acid degradation operon negative regulatory protein
MSTRRNDPDETSADVVAVLAAEPPLTTRSVLASTLLGTRPPRLPVGRLVRAGALFGVAEGTVRTALSRMAAAGEVEAVDGWYRLSGRLVERQQRQDASRSAARLVPWSGRWWMAVVRAARRPAAERARLRAAMTTLRFGELREGVWLRPANLDPERSPAAGAALAEQCHRFDVDSPHGPQGSPQGPRGSPQDESAAGLAASLWDLAGWAARARALERALDALVGTLERHDPAALAPGFVLSAAVLRHFQADPLLPDELLPSDWPGDDLRQHYDRYDRAYGALLAEWFAGAGKHGAGYDGAG